MPVGGMQALDQILFTNQATKQLRKTACTSLHPLHVCLTCSHKCAAVAAECCRSGAAIHLEAAHTGPAIQADQPYMPIVPQEGNQGLVGIR
jgi:hypothetical protein